MSVMDAVRESCAMVYVVSKWLRVVFVCCIRFSISRVCSVCAVRCCAASSS